ncbi:double-strand break repair helicase AddA, partial [Mesorhizobium sp. M8A.F.Ca.ET.059.01.1.1]
SQAPNWPPVAPGVSEQARQADAFGPLPATLFRPLPPFEDLPRPLSPSGASALIEEGKEAVVDKASPVLDADAEPGFAVMRGLALHKLLQMLPGIAESGRQSAAERYLSRTGAGWPQAEREKALASVMAILADPGLGQLFAPSSR